MRRTMRTADRLSSRRTQKKLTKNDTRTERVIARTEKACCDAAIYIDDKQKQS